MSLHPHHNTDVDQADGLLSAINDLAANTQDEVQARRFANRLELNCATKLVPGNVSSRDGTEFDGKCRDVSDNGCRLVLSRPLIVGDIYLIEIDSPTFRGDLVFGRCVRCHMLREDTFDCGLNFLSPVSIESTQASQAKSSSLIDLDLG